MFAVVLLNKIGCFVCVVVTMMYIILLPFWIYVYFFSEFATKCQEEQESCTGSSLHVSLLHRVSSIFIKETHTNVVFDVCINEK